MTVGGLIHNLTIFADFYERASADIDREEGATKPWYIGNRDATANVMRRDFCATVAIDRVRAYVLSEYGTELTIGTARRLLGDLIQKSGLSVDAAGALFLEVAIDKLTVPPASVLGPVPPCPGCGGAPAATDVDDICPACGAYKFLCGIAEHVPLDHDAPIIKQQMARPRWKRIPPSKVKAKKPGDAQERRDDAAPIVTTERALKRSTERGEGRVKLIAALTNHHQYANSSCLNLEPIGNNDLAKAAGVSASTASAFFNDKFEGHTRYKALCRDSGGLVAALKLLNSEFAPHDLYGRRPAGEDGRDDE
jgi:hypothetical protein